MARQTVLGAPVARLVPWVVLVVSLATTGVLYGSILRAVQRRNDDEFEKESARLDRRINDVVREQASVLQAIAAAVATDPDLDEKKFAAFYAGLTRGEAARLPTVVGLSLWRPWARRNELMVEARRRGVTAFRLRPSDSRPEAHAIVLVQPPNEANRSVVGYDMHSDPVRRKAMDAARDSGRATLTERATLVQDGVKDIPALLIYLPVYDGPTPWDVAERRRRLKGFVYSGLRTQALFSRLQSRLDGASVGIRVWAGDPKDANKVYDLFDGEEIANSRRRPIKLTNADGKIEAELLAYPNFGSPASVRPFVLPVGGLISVMLFLLATTLRRAHEASERYAAEQSLLSEVGRLTAGSSDDDAVLTDITQAIARILGAVARIDLVEPNGSLRAISTRTLNPEALLEIERERPRMEYDLYLKDAMETGRTQRGDQGYTPRDEAHRLRLEKLDIGSVVVVPMLARGRAIGAITLTRRKGQPLLSDDAAALSEAIAGRIALAVDNARLYRAAQQEIAERTAAEAEVRRLNDGLEEIVAERTRDLEASNHELESFCYSVSHDLRTPLRSLDGFGKALEEDYGDRLDEQGLNYIERIRASTKRMDELITALLTLSRLTRREIVPVRVDVTAAVRDLMQDLDPQGLVELDLEDGLVAQADPRMLSVVFENLLTNAMKFSARTMSPRIAVGKAANGALFVRDNGAGFDMRYAAKLFQPFERLHSVREFPGHGIGLATVERIVKRHGGEVRAEGRPGDGATFFIKFPK